MQRNTLVKSGATVAAAAALALGGTALANADQSPTPPPSQSPAATPTPGQPGAKDTARNHAANRAAHEAQLLSGTTAVKVTQAATAKEPTAKLEHVGADPAGGYTARMVRTDGTPIVLRIDASFTVTSDETAPPRPPGGPHGKGRPQGPGQPGQPAPQGATPGQPAQPAQPAQPGKAKPAPSGTPTS